ncbi:fukutin [Lampris incognitus]|uniref:fukutin n=1 Tax=Lampris incognitus TaxID=2546036 RepID=UPI0024B59A2F|nr:fukutin [Lampris incognitus]
MKGTQPGPHILGRTGHLTAHDVQWHTVKKFLSLVQRYNLPVFLADPASLALLSQDSLLQKDSLVQEPHCTFLCTGQPITSFALLANLWKYDVSILSIFVGFVTAVQEKGFELLVVRGKDPRLASMDDLSGEEIPLHFLFRMQFHVIQVVLLYERSGNYLWHGALRLKPNADPNFAPYRKLDYGHHAGAYDRPELVLTTLDGLDIRIPRNLSQFLAERSRSRFLECRYREARNFYQLYPDDSSPEATDFRLKAKALLHLAARTLNRLGVPFWLSSGTCLGWFRQCGIIPYSRDVDLGVFISDFRPDVISAFQNAGLPLKHKFGKVEDSLELSFQGHDVKLDIFFFYEDGEIMWNGGTQAKSGRKFKYLSIHLFTYLFFSIAYVFPCFTLCWTELLELKVRVPCQTRDYVEANYGPSWDVPVRNWDWKTSPGNVLDNGRWPPHEWDQVIQVY